MTNLGAQLSSIDPGQAVIEMPCRSDLSLRGGPLHGSIVATLLDTACGHAALSQLSPAARGATAKFKIDLLAPAFGERLIAQATVKRLGRTLITCTADAYTTGVKNGPRLVATMLAPIAVSSLGSD